MELKMCREAVFLLFPRHLFYPFVSTGLVIPVIVCVIGKDHNSFQRVQRVVGRVSKQNDLDRERIAPFPVRIDVSVAFPGEMLVYPGKNVVALSDIVFRMESVLFVAQYVNACVGRTIYRPYPVVYRRKKSSGIYLVGIVGQRTNTGFDVKGTEIFQ